jgi:hypothetical protein
MQKLHGFQNSKTLASLRRTNFAQFKLKPGECSTEKVNKTLKIGVKNKETIIMVSRDHIPTLHFFRKLRIGPISLSVCPDKSFRLQVMKHSSLIGPFVSYKENEVL